MLLLLPLALPLSCALLCSCSACLCQRYVELLEHLFSYSSQQLQALQRQQPAIDEYLREEQQHRLQFPRALAQLGQAKRGRTPAELGARIGQCCDLIAEGLQLVLEDEVTPRFAAAAPPAGEWNLLTRNLRQQKRQLSWRLQLLWLLSLLLRYTLLVPLRCLGIGGCILLVTLLTALLGQLPNRCSWKRSLVQRVLRQCFLLSTCFIPVVRRIHNAQHRPQFGICVCNHTSPLDVIVLMCDVHYSLTGQRQDGILGIIQRALVRASPHLWFERSALLDRQALCQALRLHAADSNEPPILLFPEGTCINNTAVMQFRKGGFAICNVVYPVALRYDRRFGDAFWDSTRCSMLRYLLLIMSSWSITCDVWYMPPHQRLPSESALDFSRRVKAAIAAQAGIDDLPWDGNLKRSNPVRDWQ
ncbi:CG15450 [Drosophila busckii]|uniref:CG15450 n=2 Tax=Drosophila busckii TaxID=30019 RepID=A0A0M4EN61_DROBS|nr:CG15450 [Drosophila busckii]